MIESQQASITTAMRARYPHIHSLTNTKHRILLHQTINQYINIHNDVKHTCTWWQQCCTRSPHANDIYIYDAMRSKTLQNKSVDSLLKWPQHKNRGVHKTDELFIYHQYCLGYDYGVLYVVRSRRKSKKSNSTIYLYWEREKRRKNHKVWIRIKNNRFVKKLRLNS